MIKNNLTPTEKFIKFIEANSEHPKLRIEIKIYADEPVATTGNVSIHTTVEILEEDNNLFGILLYEAIFTESEVEVQFKEIIGNPMKFKTSSRTYENKQK